MKKLVGQREVVDLDLKNGIAILSLFTLYGPSPTEIHFNESCGACKAPVLIALSENTTTGEIWLEGPDHCEKCGQRISDPDAHNEMLSQEAIAGFFGKF